MFINFNRTKAVYAYDETSRLILLENKNSNNEAISRYRFTLDANGNRIKVDQKQPLETIVTNQTIAYAYNAQGNRLLLAGADIISHDKEGQVKEANKAKYLYDHLRRLVCVDGSSQLTFAYDGGDRRLEAARDGITNHYIYDFSGNLLAEATDRNSITQYFIYGLGLLELITASADAYCYHFDAIGSTIATTDAHQQIRNHYAYLPYGEVIVQQESTPNPFKFVGQHGVHTETGALCYIGSRYYSSVFGRFISSDRAGFAGGHVNLYAYANNNPIRLIDYGGYSAGDLYASATEAAIAAVSEINSISIAKNREYAGRVYKLPDGSYSYTEARAGSFRASRPGNWPAGSENAGWYHTHGRSLAGFDNEIFSEADKNISRAEKVPAFLGTPGGTIQKYNPYRDRVVSLGTVTVNPAKP